MWLKHIIWKTQIMKNSQADKGNIITVENSSVKKKTGRDHIAYMAKLEGDRSVSPANLLSTLASCHFWMRLRARDGSAAVAGHCTSCAHHQPWECWTGVREKGSGGSWRPGEVDCTWYTGSIQKWTVIATLTGSPVRAVKGNLLKRWNFEQCPCFSTWSEMRVD